MAANVSAYPVSQELDELQDATMLLLSAVWDEIDQTLGDSSEDKEVLQTLKQLFHYMSG